MVLEDKGECKQRHSKNRKLVGPIPPRRDNSEENTGRELFYTEKETYYRSARHIQICTGPRQRLHAQTINSIIRSIDYIRWKSNTLCVDWIITSLYPLHLTIVAFMRHDLSVLKHSYLVREIYTGWRIVP